MTRALILGGGVAGLAAAYRLLQLRPDWDVLVLEGADRVGGLAASWRSEKFAADLGPHRVYTELPEIEALLPELIEREQMLTVRRRSRLLLDGHFYRYPVSAWELLRQMGLLKIFPLAASAIAAKLKGKKGASHENYEQAMMAAFGEGAYRLILEPYTRKVWKVEPSELSAEVARVRVSAGDAGKLLRQGVSGKTAKKRPSALSSFGYIRGGVEGLVRSLETKVRNLGGRISLGQRVEGFEHQGEETRLTGARASERRGEAQNVAQERRRRRDAAAGIEEATPFPGNDFIVRDGDQIISTVPVTDLVRTLQEISPDPEAAAAASELVYIGLVLVGFILKRPQLTENSWIYFPEEKFVFNRSYEPKNFDPSMAPTDRTLVVFEVTARWDSDLWKKRDAEIMELVRTDALKTGLFREDEIENMLSMRIPHTYPLYTKTYDANLATIFKYLKRFPNLITTGRQGLFNHNNMDHSMLMGIRAAEYTAEAGAEGSPAERWYNDLKQFAHFRIVD